MGGGGALLPWSNLQYQCLAYHRSWLDMDWRGECRPDHQLRPPVKCVVIMNVAGLE